MMIRSRLLFAITVILSSFLVLVLVLPLVIPVHVPPDLVDEHALAKPESRFVKLGELELHYVEKGTGPRGIILMHSGAHTLHAFDGVLDGLAKHGRVIAYDRNGYGLSSRPLEWSGESPYSGVAQADLVEKLATALGLEKVVLVGNSAGGTIAMLAALRHPTRIESLVVISPGIYSGLDDGAPWLGRTLMATPQAKRIGPAIVRRQVGGASDEILKAFWHDPAKLPPERLALHKEQLRTRHFGEALFAQFRVMEPLGIKARLAELRMPVLVVTGDDDKFVPLEENQRLAKELPDARLEVMKGCGHAAQEECPDMFVRALDAFLAPTVAR